GFEEAIIRAANAGVDLLWICHSVESQNRAIDVLIRAVESGDVPRSRLEEASRRMDVVFAKYMQPPRREPDMSVIGCAEHQSIAAEIERRAGAEAIADEDATENFVRQQNA